MATADNPAGLLECCLARRPHVGTLAGVKRLKTFVTMLVLALWLPATSHALLERAGWIHTPHTDEEGARDTDNDHDAADGFCHVASTDVHVPQPELNGGQSFAFSGFALTFASLFEPSLALPNGPDPPGAAPPELSQTWQFSFRASLPPRAPSMIS
jgi:hypothetical protein